MRRTAYGVDVEDGDLNAFGMQEAGDGRAELAEADHQGGAAVENIAALPHDGLGGEDDGLADEEVLGVLQRGARHGDDGAGQLLEVLVPSMAVLRVLDDSQETTGEPVVHIRERRGEVATNVQQTDRLARGPGFEVVQGGVDLGEPIAGERIDRVRLLHLSACCRVDGLRLGQHRGQPGHGGDGADEGGAFGE